MSSLTSIFRGADEAVKAEAAGALWALSDRHDANKVGVDPDPLPSGAPFHSNQQCVFAG